MNIDEQRVRAALARLLPARDVPRELEWRLLAGGVNARSAHVSFSGREWVLRFSHEGASSLLDVAGEARVQAAAAAAGLAPPVVGVDEDSELLATEYLAGARPWDPAAARDVRNIQRIARTLRALHGVDVVTHRYAATAIAQSYVRDDAIAGHADTVARAPDLLELAHRYDARYPPSTLCHNDLVAANVLDDGSLKLVDFEYAVLGTPMLDLAGLAAMNDYSAAQCSALLAAYYGDCVAPERAEDLVRIMRMLRLMSLFWARIGAARAVDPVAHSQIAEQMLERLK